MDQPIGAKEFIELFTGILHEDLPFIILGAIISGLLKDLVQQILTAPNFPPNP